MFWGCLYGSTARRSRPTPRSVQTAAAGFGLRLDRGAPPPSSGHDASTRDGMDPWQRPASVINLLY